MAGRPLRRARLEREARNNPRILDIGPPPGFGLVGMPFEADNNQIFNIETLSELFDAVKVSNPVGRFGQPTSTFVVIGFNYGKAGKGPTYGVVVFYDEDNRYENMYGNIPTLDEAETLAHSVAASQNHWAQRFGPEERALQAKYAVKPLFEGLRR